MLVLVICIFLGSISTRLRSRCVVILSADGGILFVRLLSISLVRLCLRAGGLDCNSVCTHSDILVGGGVIFMRRIFVKRFFVYTSPF
jgi:hypothetical protein